MPYEPQYEKITNKELNPELRSQINESHDHIYDIKKHITEEERALWNTITPETLASSTKNGLMTADMVKKLENIEVYANNYVHPITDVTAGRYLVTTVDKYGHVVKGENPNVLDITVSSANKLGEYTADSFARIMSPQFMGAPTAPTVSNDTVGNNIATTKYVHNILNMALGGEAYIHPESGITTDGLPEGWMFKGSTDTYNNLKTVYSDAKEGWVVQVTDTNKYYYYNGKTWTETTIAELKDMWTGTYGTVTVNRQGHVISGTKMDSIVKDLMLKIYPVGHIYISMSSTNPGTLFGGTWKAISQGRALIGVGDGYEPGNVGGEKTHKLTTNEVPAHTHTRGTMNITGTFPVMDDLVDTAANKNAFTGAFEYTTTKVSSAAGDHDETSKLVKFNASNAWTGETSSVGGGQAHNNMQPYLVVYMWQRIA